MSEPIGAGVEEPENLRGAFPRLDDQQRARLRELGTVRTVESGDVLFRDGDAGYDFFVVESGAVAIVQGYGRENRVIAVHGPHRFLGELNMLTGSRLYLTAVVRDPGEVIQVPRRNLLRLVTEDDGFANLILQAYIARREILIASEAGVKVVGSRYSQDTRRVREFLARNRVPHRWMDLETDEEADALLHALGVKPCDTPVIVGADGVVRNPSNAEISAMLGLGASGPPPALCDLVIVGGGPAGLAAALYGASEGLDTQAIDAVAFGGQASTSSRIENYLGFPVGISGSELAERAALQARRFGARLEVPAEAVGFAREDGHYSIRLAGGDTVNGRTVIVATGAQYRKLDVPDLERFEGNGVYYAATPSEAQICAGEPVVIVGGGNSAGQATMFLSAHAASCSLLIRSGDLGKSMSRYLVDELEGREQADVHTYSEVVELGGESGLESVVIRDTRTGERHEMPAKALFVFIGASPHTEWLRGEVAMDEDCFLLTGRDVQDRHLEGHSDERPYFWRQAGRACSPSATSTRDRSSGSPQRWARARWPCSSSTSASPPADRMPARAAARHPARGRRGPDGHKSVAPDAPCPPYGHTRSRAPVGTRGHPADREDKRGDEQPRDGSDRQ
jgi:thioredoxin reductase (NADPH)